MRRVCGLSRLSGLSRLGRWIGLIVGGGIARRFRVVLTGATIRNNTISDEAGSAVGIGFRVGVRIRMRAGFLTPFEGWGWTVGHARTPPIKPRGARTDINRCPV